MLLRHRLQAPERRIGIGTPDVAAIDDANGQHLVRRGPIGHAGQLFRRAHRIDVQAGHGQLAGESQVLGQRRKIGREQQLRCAARQLPIAALESLAPGFGQVEAEDGFVDLHPFHALLLEPREHLFIDRQQLLEQREAVEPGFLFLAKPQKAQRPQQHGLDGVTRFLRLRHFVEQAGRGQAEARGEDSGTR